MPDLISYVSDLISAPGLQPINLVSGKSCFGNAEGGLIFSHVF
jgi:hypothetical protein